MGSQPIIYGIGSVPLISFNVAIYFHSKKNYLFVAESNNFINFSTSLTFVIQCQIFP